MFLLYSLTQQVYDISKSITMFWSKSFPDALPKSLLVGILRQERDNRKDILMIKRCYFLQQIKNNL